MMIHTRVAGETAMNARREAPPVDSTGKPSNAAGAAFRRQPEGLGRFSRSALSLVAHNESLLRSSLRALRENRIQRARESSY